MSTKIHPIDLKYVPVDPVDGFDPDHNRDVIERTINWTDAMSARKDREYQDTLKERTSAFAQYVSDVNGGRTTADVEKYFGKRFLAYLKGRFILDKIKEQMGKK